MGPARPDASSQRQCLVGLSMRYVEVVRGALDALYRGEELFGNNPELRLITRVAHLAEGFADLMSAKGHAHMWNESRSTGRTSTPSEEDEFGRTRPTEDTHFGPVSRYEKAVAEYYNYGLEFKDLPIHLTKLDCSPPAPDGILKHIEACYNETRSLDLGTFGGNLLTKVFVIQASRWPHFTRCHVNTMVIVVHRFIVSLMNAIFPDKRMREGLWNAILRQKTMDRYRRAVEQADFLVGIEVNGRPLTINHYFNTNLQKARIDRLTKNLDRVSTPVNYPNSGSTVNLNINSLTNLVDNKSNVDQIKEDVHDILKGYYKFARKRYVDVVSMQAVRYFLLDSPDSPLLALTPTAFLELSDVQLDMIAGESAVTKRERERLESEIKGLEEAMSVLGW